MRQWLIPLDAAIVNSSDLNQLMTFAYSVLKRYWQVVEDNREKLTNSFPMELLYLLNDKSVNLLEDELNKLELK